MANISLTVNQQNQTVDVDPQTPLLWVLRDSLGLVGTKYGCGIAQCGACTVHIDGVAVRSCTLTAAAAEGKKITTIEGLAGERYHPVQEAWIEEDVSQCGYCQSGQIMTTAALLQKNRNPTDEDIDVALAGHICRCGTYKRIRNAVHIAAGKM